jgi:hypothetical protein
VKAIASLLAVAVVSSPAAWSQKSQVPLKIVGAEPAANRTPASSPGASTAPAQGAASAATTAPTTTDGRYMLRDGDDVALAFAQDISSKTAAEGDPVVFTLADDLKVNGVVVAKEGSKAVGEVTRAEHSGMMGKAGQLSIRMDYLKVGDTKVHLRGTKGKEGESGTTSTIVLTVLFGPIGLIKHGKNIDIKQGAKVTAFVSDDTLLPAAM